MTATVPDFSPSGILVKEIDSLICGTRFVDQVTGDIWRHDYDNKLLILLEDKDCDIAGEFQNFLDNF